MLPRRASEESLRVQARATRIAVGDLLPPGAPGQRHQSADAAHGIRIAASVA
ncbi:MAG: hypothetical protein IPK54_07990 [Dokdonella sp.]|uniref:hypothetical protein n=1 Tax=Dokdonella sp. TaxID=2291710 RepID=UPI0025B83503|nr:hypothetical protein [Dokdonella sp.]MBK8123480.1 hypothetical protein [Dokdonella sp.]